MPEEGWRVKQPKHCDYDNNCDEEYICENRKVFVFDCALIFITVSFSQFFCLYSSWGGRAQGQFLSRVKLILIQSYTEKKCIYFI